MKIIKVFSFAEINKVYLRPWTRYVMSDMEVDQLFNYYLHQVAYRDDVYKKMFYSSFNSYEKRYAGQDANGKKILLYRHNAWGDSLIASAVPRYLKTKYPHVEIYQYCHPEMFRFWLGNQYLSNNSACPLAIPFDGVLDYDYHILYEGMLEGDGEPDQKNCYDSMFHFIGMDPPDFFKRPYIFIRPDDYAAMGYLKDIINLDDTYVVYHFSPANENRAYPYFLARKFWELFLESFPNHKLYIVGLDEGRDRSSMFKDLPEDRCINLLSKLKCFRHLVPIIEQAKAVVCPDTAIGHLAACFPQVPVISLWGLFSPADRVKYYGNHYPLWHPESCPNCPCHNHNFTIPIELCRKANMFEEVRHRSPQMFDNRETVDWCSALWAISPEEIVAALGKVLKGWRTETHMKIMLNKECIMPKLKEGDYKEVDVMEGYV